MDLNRSDVVEEWVCFAANNKQQAFFVILIFLQRVSDTYPVNEIIPATKYAPTTPAKTVVGLNNVGFFLIDPRLNQPNKMVESKSHFYLNSKPEFRYFYIIYFYFRGVINILLQMCCYNRHRCCCNGFRKRRNSTVQFENIGRGTQGFARRWPKTTRDYFVTRTRGCHNRDRCYRRWKMDPRHL